MPPPSLAKTVLVDQLRAHLEAERDVAASAVASATTAATHAEAKPENKYDTRGLEASYLAGAQSARLATLQDALVRLARMPLLGFGPTDPVRLSAVIELDVDGETSWVFLTEVGAGYALALPQPPATRAGATARTVTTLSPLGRVLIGARTGDLVTVRVGADERAYELLQVF